MHHTAIALVMQAVIGVTIGNWLAGGVFGAGFYIGREITAAEYRWIERFGMGRRTSMPWWGGFDPRVWNCKSTLDWLLPVIAVTVVYRVMKGM